MQLYSFFNSSTSYRVRIALALKSIDYSTSGINIRTGEQDSEDYLSKAVIKGVPTLVDGEFSLNQSLAIIDYLDSVNPEPRLIPQEQPLRARVLELSSIIACDIHPVNNLKVLKFLSQKAGVSEELKKDWYAHWVHEGFDAVERSLSRYRQSGPFCFGEKVTLADVCLIPQVANASRFGVDISKYTVINSIYEHCMTLQPFIDASPSNQPDFIG